MQKAEPPPEAPASSQLSPRLRGRWGYERLGGALVLLGIALRLEQYFHNRSLWLDEAMMGLNILHRSLPQLAQPLDFHLVAPIAWLFATKACNLLLGNREWALRLPQILAGIMALIAVMALGKRLLPPRAVGVAVAWFALSQPLIYYSSELKPYGSDPAVAALLWLAGFWALAKPTGGRLALLAAAGALAIWFSHPAVFVLAGMGLTILCWSLAAGGWRKLSPFLPALLLWAASFGLDYMFFLRAGSHDKLQLNNYPPLRLSLWHFAPVEKILEMLFLLQQNPLSILFGVVLLAFCVGCACYWRHHRLALSLLLTPLFFSLLAASLHLYPTVGRFYLFFTPAVALLIAAGAETMLQAGKATRVPIGAVLIVLLFVQPVLSARELMAHPINAEELRPVLAYVQQHQQPDEAWYVYCYTRFAYQYYAEVYGLGGKDVVIGSCSDGVHRDMFEKDAAGLRGRRVWVLISNPGRTGGVDEFSMVAAAFDARGVRRQAYWQPGAVAFLYTMKP